MDELKTTGGIQKVSLEVGRQGFSVEVTSTSALVALVAIIVIGVVAITFAALGVISAIS